ncbi:MAG: hypothetical protein IPP07_17420 [Holophagales bacterium]|nr:hypothetical protein [Holophagales bacterium]
MRRRIGLWLLALLLTLSSAIWQRASTGPTNPVRGKVTLGGDEIRLPPPPLPGRRRRPAGRREGD